MKKYLNELEKAIQSGDIRYTSLAIRMAFHWVYDNALTVGYANVEGQTEIIALFDKATLMNCSEENLPHKECIIEKAKWIHVLFEQGDKCVHELIRKKLPH